MAKAMSTERKAELDRLGQVCRDYVYVKNSIDELEKSRKALAEELKAKIAVRGSVIQIKDPTERGVSYSVKITEVSTTRLDTELVKRVLDEEQLELCSKTSTSERITVDKLKELK